MGYHRPALLDESIKGLDIKDRTNNDFIVIEELRVDIDILTIISTGDIFIKDVFLKNGEVNLIYDPKGKDMNMNEFINAINELTKSDKPRDPNLVCRLP